MFGLVLVLVCVSAHISDVRELHGWVGGWVGGWVRFALFFAGVLSLALSLACELSLSPSFPQPISFPLSLHLFGTFSSAPASYRQSTHSITHVSNTLATH
jgi:hypothetical protein